MQSTLMTYSGCMRCCQLGSLEAHQECLHASPLLGGMRGKPLSSITATTHSLANKLCRADACDGLLQHTGMHCELPK